MYERTEKYNYFQRNIRETVFAGWKIIECIILAGVVEAEEEDAQLLVGGGLELPQDGQQTHTGDLEKKKFPQLFNCRQSNFWYVQGVKLFIGSEVLCILCFEICSPEGR